MPKTHLQHLKDHGYTPTAKDTCSGKAAEEAYQTLVTAYGEDSVWDYRIMDEVFSTNDSSLAWGFLFNVVKKDTGEIGILSQTDFANEHGVPRFYYGWRANDDQV